LFDYLRKNAGEGGGGGGGRFGGRSSGSIEEGLAAADQRLKQTYTVAYIAHAPLEPRAAVAEWADGKLTVWTGTQRPFGVRGELAQAFGLADDRVRVIVPDTGSGYGGKHNGDAAVEAARIAKAAGKPVKLVWTREEEFTWAYFRPAGVIDVASGVRSDGTLTAWEFTNYNSGGSSINSPYEVPNERIAVRPTKSPLRQGSYRALAATANTFARETHIDELASAVGMDPLAFRRANLKDDRLRAVMEAAAAAFGWGLRQPQAEHGQGIAIGTEKGSYVATCAEVRVDHHGSVQVVRVTAAFECGAVVNPQHLKNQVEGAIVMGLGGAMFEEIKFADGVINNPAFSGYRVPRFRDAPAIEVVLVDRKDLPSTGAGETPIIAIAPAIGNALFAATGTRLRSLPLAPNGLG
jgi:isoquinoline 1-oxidoreductase